MPQLDSIDGQQVRVWTVSELTAEIRDTLFSRPELRQLWVAGEVSNMSTPASGHCYFTLKDSSSSIRCVMFRRHASSLTFELDDGMDVVAFGNIDVYERHGQYQLYVREVEPSGVGSLYIAFQQLRHRLTEEGLFDAERKRPLPAMPQNVGVVTSRYSAAFRDIVKVIQRRDPGCNILLSHSTVQGDSAPAQLVSALHLVQRCEEVEVIIIARGGGSLEDLQPFNDEEVVRAVVQSSVPIVAGVGHETDVTLCGLAADSRAATPSAAAELVVTDRKQVAADLCSVSAKIVRRLERLILDKRARLKGILSRRSLQRPEDILTGRRQTLDALADSIMSSQKHNVRDHRHRVVTLTQRLQALNPASVLRRGYSIVRDDSGQVLRNAEDVEVSDHILIELQNGELDAEVLRTHHKQ